MPDDLAGQIVGTRVRFPARDDGSPEIVLGPGYLADATTLHVLNRHALEDSTRLALCEWLRFHGLDPDNVTYDPIVRDVEACRVRATVFLRDRTGHRFLVDRNDFDSIAQAYQYAQGEAPPLPWPAEVWPRD